MLSWHQKAYKEGLILYEKLNQILNSRKLKELGLMVSIAVTYQAVENEIKDEHCKDFFLNGENLGLCYSIIPLLGAYVTPSLYMQSQSLDNADPVALADLTRISLIINSDNYSSWNIRKNLLLKDRLETLSELNFITFLLSKFGKSEETWEHRRWVIVEHLKKSNSSDIKDIVNNEIKVCIRSAELFPRNIYAWKHRLWVFQNYYTLFKELLPQELTDTEFWIKKHISDNSARCYREQLILESLHSSPNDFPRLLQKELDWNKDNLLYYVGKESVWQYRKFLIFVILKSSSEFDFNEELNFVLTQANVNEQKSFAISYLRYVHHKLSLQNFSTHIITQYSQQLDTLK